MWNRVCCSSSGILFYNTRLSITQLMNTTKPDMDEIETQTSRVEVFEQHLSVMREFQDKIQEIETEDVEQVDGSLDEEDAANVTDSADTEEMRNEHVLQQAKLGRQLQELNNMLQKKQELASQMLQNDEQLLEMRQQYEVSSHQFLYFILLCLVI